MKTFFIVFIVLALIIWIVYTINDFRVKEVKVSEGLSGVEVALTKRYDVLSKMLDASREYLAYEQKLFLETVSIRNHMSLSEISHTEEQMDQVSERIYAAAEAYPSLKSSQVFKELQAGIDDAEQHLEAARRVYNSNVRIYNTAIAKYPAHILALGRKPAAFFEAKNGVHVDLKITF